MIENMPCSRRRTSSERKINAVIDTILKKDSCGDRDLRKPRRDKKNVKQSGYGKCQAKGNEVCVIFFIINLTENSIII